MPSAPADFLKILHALRSSDQPVSGQALARNLGITRVALWKKIQALRGFGYEIQGAKGGYRLTSEDVLESWEFPGEEETTFHWATTTSTMDRGWELAQKGAPHGTLITADHQTKGRGQQQRPWFSDPGNLQFTLLLRPEVPQRFAGAFVLEALTRLCSWIEDRTGLEARWQWPNDLMIQGRKIGGILAETQASSGILRVLVLGVGINVRTGPNLDRPAASLSDLSPRPISRRDLIQDFRPAFCAWAHSPVLEPRFWESKAATGGVWTARCWDGSSIQGPWQGLEPDGTLVLFSEKKIRWGETLRIENEGAHP